MMKNKKVRAIAFYLPQFYPTKENDEWWSPGFTEWTNVGKAKPLFRGHIQPRVPADLGYYDLRIEDVREQQAKLAQDAGIEGFCYWHYWFNGRRLLDRVFSEVVKTGKPDFPFCLCWANHSWYKKTWDPSKGSNKLLIEQTYGGVEDFTNHFYAMLPAFKDSRYMKVDGKLIFGIFDVSFQDYHLFSKTWNELANKNGLEGFFFFGLCSETYIIDKAKISGIENIVVDNLVDAYYHADSIIKRKYGFLKRKYFHKPYVVHYEKYVQYAIDYLESHYENTPNMIPCIEPGFDHSPRSAELGVVFDRSTPNKWGELCRNVINIISRSNTHTDRLLFIKAWNEWAEGNYLEPDIKYGKGYLEEFAKNNII